jgi:hypothetical protein
MYVLLAFKKESHKLITSSLGDNIFLDSSDLDGINDGLDAVEVAIKRGRSPRSGSYWERVKKVILETSSGVTDVDKAFKEWAEAGDHYISQTRCSCMLCDYPKLKYWMVLEDPNLIETLRNEKDISKIFPTEARHAFQLNFVSDMAHSEDPDIRTSYQVLKFVQLVLKGDRFKAIFTAISRAYPSVSVRDIAGIKNPYYKQLTKKSLTLKLMVRLRSLILLCSLIIKTLSLLSWLKLM